MGGLTDVSPGVYSLEGNRGVPERRSEADRLSAWGWPAPNEGSSPSPRASGGAAMTPPLLHGASQLQSLCHNHQ